MASTTGLVGVLLADRTSLDCDDGARVDMDDGLLCHYDGNRLSKSLARRYKGRRMKPYSTNDDGLLDHCDGVRLGLFVGALLSDTKREAVETTHD